MLSCKSQSCEIIRYRGKKDNRQVFAIRAICCCSDQKVPGLIPATSNFSNRTMPLQKLFGVSALRKRIQLKKNNLQAVSPGATIGENKQVYELIDMLESLRNIQ